MVPGVAPERSRGTATVAQMTGVGSHAVSGTVAGALALRRWAR